MGLAAAGGVDHRQAGAVRRPTASSTALNTGFRGWPGSLGLGNTTSQTGTPAGSSTATLTLCQPQAAVQTPEEPGSWLFPDGEWGRGQGERAPTRRSARRWAREHGAYHALISADSSSIAATAAGP